MDKLGSDDIRESGKNTVQLSKKEWRAVCGERGES